MRPEVVINIGIVIAAIVLAAGWICILWRRDGQRFALMQLALEKGVTRFPNTPPFWLLSLRQGVTVLALGVALCGVGAGALLVARNVPEPTAAQQMQAMPGNMGHEVHTDWRRLPPGPGPDDDQNPPPPPRQGPGPYREQGQGPPPMPPIAVPVVENWHRAQAMRTIGLLSLACGAVLLVLGIVRIAFSAVERVAADDPTRG